MICSAHGKDQETQNQLEHANNLKWSEICGLTPAYVPPAIPYDEYLKNKDLSMEQDTEKLFEKSKQITKAFLKAAHSKTIVVYGTLEPDYEQISEGLFDFSSAVERFNMLHEPKLKTPEKPEELWYFTEQAAMRFVAEASSIQVPLVTIVSMEPSNRRWKGEPIPHVAVLLIVDNPKQSSKWMQQLNSIANHNGLRGKGHTKASQPKHFIQIQKDCVHLVLIILYIFKGRMYVAHLNFRDWQRVLARMRVHPTRYLVSHLQVGPNIASRIFLHRPPILDHHRPRHPVLSSQGGTQDENSVSFSQTGLTQESVMSSHDMDIDLSTLSEGEVSLIKMIRKQGVEPTRIFAQIQDTETTTIAGEQVDDDDISDIDLSEEKTDVLVEKEWGLDDSEKKTIETTNTEFKEHVSELSLGDPEFFIKVQQLMTQFETEVAHSSHKEKTTKKRKYESTD